MSDDAKKPDPVDDLKKGIGLLFRAAKTAAEQLHGQAPGKLEQVVVSGVKEVGRAIENVTDQLDRQVFGGKGTIPHPEDAAKPGAPPADASPAPPGAKPAAPPDVAADAAESTDETKDTPAEKTGEKADESPKGPRVA